MSDTFLCRLFLDGNKSIIYIYYIYIYIYIYVYIYIRIPRSFGIHIHIISNHYYEVTTFLVCEYFCHLNQKLE